MIAFRFLLEVRPGENEEVVRHVGERNPHFLAVEQVAVTVLDGGCLDADRIGAGRRFRQAEGARSSHRGRREQVLFLLLFVSPGEQRERIKADMYREDDTGRGIGVLELLAGETERYVVHAEAAVLLRNAEAQRLAFAMAGIRSGLTFWARSYSVILGRRPFGHLARHVPHRQLVFGVREIYHRSAFSLFR